MKKNPNYPEGKAAPAVLREVAWAEPAGEASMVRTQIYLSAREHEFLQAEARRRDEPMAAVIRELIDEKMNLPEAVWKNNPMLRPAPVAPDWVGHEDGALNHDHYIAGSPKRSVKVEGDWRPAPALPENHYRAGSDGKRRPSRSK